MVDPTQATRDALAAGLKKIIPSRSPLAISGESAVDPQIARLNEIKRNAASQGIPSEEENLVMARTAPTTAELQQDIVDPDIPVTPPTQTVSTQQAAARTPALETPVQPQAPQTPQLTGADAGYDKIMGELDAFRADEEKSLELKRQAVEKEKTEINNKLAEIEKNPIQLDNRSLWAKSTTGNKIVLALGALFSSLNPNSAKAFQDSIQNTIDADVKAQMDAINNQREDKKSLLVQLKNITGDLSSAESVYKSQIYNILANKAKLTAEKAQSRLQREQAMITYGLAKEKAAMEYAQYEQKAFEKKQEGAIPGYKGNIKDPAQARAFTESKNATDIATSSIKQLIDIASGARVPLSANSKKYSILEEKLAAEVAKANAGGKPSDVEIENAKKMLPSIYSPNYKEAMIELANRLKKDLSIKEKNLQISPIGRPASFEGNE